MSRKQLQQTLRKEILSCYGDATHSELDKGFSFLYECYALALQQEKLTAYVDKHLVRVRKFLSAEILAVLDKL